ncbi:MAG: FAD-dependent oxidoreductase [Phycisphaerales bacterium]|nr:FAD-dependent oxidoreductase [Phycisphaerales bacterium]
MNEHVIIIGGGIIGLLSGRELLARGRAVTILDRGDLRDSASTGNAGVISPGHAPIPTPEVAAKAIRMMLDPRSPLYIPPRPSLSLLRWLLSFRRACRPAHFRMSSEVLDRFSKLSRERFEPLIEECPKALEPTGFADIALTPQGRDHLDHEAERLTKSGFNVEFRTGDELRREDPSWSDDVIGGLVQHDGIVARPDDLIRHLAQRFEADGGILRTNATVENVHLEGGCFESIELADGERIQGGTLLVTAGIWSSGLARDLNIRIPMQAAKGYHVMIEMENPPRMASVLSEACIVVNPMGNQVRLAGTLELSGINDRMVQRRLDMLPAAADRYIHGVRKARRHSEWNGLRPCTADGLPVIGPVPETGNAYLATGHAMMGVTLGPGTSQLIADCIDGQPLPDWAQPMDVKRFA